MIALITLVQLLSERDRIVIVQHDRVVVNFNHRRRLPRHDAMLFTQLCVCQREIAIHTHRLGFRFLFQCLSASTGSVWKNGGLSIFVEEHLLVVFTRALTQRNRVVSAQPRTVR